MRKINGIMSILGDNERREISVSDTGEITGDDVVAFHLTMNLAFLQKDGDAVGPTGYLPAGDYNKDLLAILIVANQMLDDVEITGKWPKVEGGVM